MRGPATHAGAGRSMHDADAGAAGTFVVVTRTPVRGQVLPPSMNHFLMADLSYVIPVSACTACIKSEHHTCHVRPKKTQKQLLPTDCRHHVA